MYPDATVIGTNLKARARPWMEKALCLLVQCWTCWTCCVTWARTGRSLQREWGLTSMWTPKSKPAFLQLPSTTAGTSFPQILAFLIQEDPSTPRIVPQAYFPHDRAEKLGPCSSLSLTRIHNLRNFGPLVFPKASFTLSGSICLHTIGWLIPLFVKHSQRKSCQQLLCIQQFSG